MRSCKPKRCKYELKLKFCFLWELVLSHGMDCFIIFFAAVVVIVLSLLFRVRTRRNESLLIFSKNKENLTNYWPL